MYGDSGPLGVQMLPRLLQSRECTDVPHSWWSLVSPVRACSRPSVENGVVSARGSERPVVKQSTGLGLPSGVRARALIAGDRSSNGEVLRALAVEAGPGVRRALAGNPSTPQDVLVELAGDELRAVRWAVALNPSSPEESLMALVSDPFNEVRCAVPIHKNCGPRVQRAVAASRGSMARQNLAGQELAADVAQSLSADFDPQVRGRLAAHTRDPDVLARLLTDPSEVVRAAAAENGHLSREQALLLAKDRSWKVRYQLAVFSRVDLPIDVLELLARDR